MRIGIVGAGEVGRLRAEALRRVAGCSLEGVADTDQDRARAIAGSSGAATFGSFDRMLAEAPVDAVIVSTPPNIHERVALAALEAGKHVLCEKPLAPTVEAGRRMVEAARERKLVLATGFNQRYFPAIQFVKQALNRGDLGELQYIKAFAGHGGLTEFRSPWEYDKQVVGGGTLMDNGIHLLDHVQYFLGAVEEVYGFASSSVWRLDGAEDNGFALLRGVNGKLAALHSSWTEWKGYHFSVMVYGDRGMAQASYGPMFAMSVVREQAGGGRRRMRHFYPWIAIREKLQGWQSTVRWTFEQELRDFVARSQGRSGVLAGGAEGLHAVEIAHAIYESSQSRSPVRLAPVS